MNAGQKLAKMFPGVPWTGGSEIHRSIARSHQWDINFSHHDIMQWAMYDGIGYEILARMKKYFPGTEWLLNEEEFCAIFYTDFYCHLKGHGSTKSPNMLRNPCTGNKFHRMVLGGNNMVGGIRYWVEEGYRQIWFRFRWEEQIEEEEEETTRLTIRNTAEEALKNMEHITEELQIKEPDVTEKVELKGKILQHEIDFSEPS